MKIFRSTHYLLPITITLIVLLIDRITKALVLSYLPYQEPVVILPFFNLFFTQNAGAAFSFLHQAGGWQNWLFSLIAVAISALIMMELWRIKANEIWRKIALALVLGGAVGNLIDRLLYQYVIDFLDFYFRDWHWPAFNIADAAICVGVGLLVLHLKDLARE